MSSFVIEGGRSLKGEIIPQGAKNEALQVICATLLTREEVIIENIPDILDVKNLISLLEDIGVEVKISLDTFPSKPAILIWHIHEQRTLCLNRLPSAAPSC